MKKMKCEICGSIDIKKVCDDVFECHECGVQYSKEEAIKLLTEICDQGSTTNTVSDANNVPIASARTENLQDLSAVADTQKARFLNSDPRLSPSAALKIENLLLAGNKLGAIGAYREATGVGLADAKIAIDKMCLRM